MNGRDQKKRKIAALIALLVVLLLTGLVYTGFIIREKVLRTDCYNRLKGIGVTLLLYADDYNNEFPPELYLLVEKEYLTTPIIYKCPATQTRMPTSFKSPREFVTDYLYFPQHRLKSGSPLVDQSVIVCDSPGNHADYGNVLYASGRVASFTGADWCQKAGIKLKSPTPPEGQK